MIEIQKVFSILESSGYEVYIAGGAVRDMIMGVEPNDYDFTTNAIPSEIIKIFEYNGFRVIPTGIKHGTVTVIIDNIPFQITTYRIDKECDGRHCKVQFTRSIEEDIKRRDLSINALIMDVNNNVTDIVGGVLDIHNKVIRTVGNPRERFTEDYLRMLRAIRFATELDFSIERNTFNIIRELHPNLTKISRERIRDEFSKIILSKHRVMGIMLLYTSNLIDIIIPEFSKLADTEQPPQFHPEGDVLTHTLLILGQIEEGDNLEIILATVLHDIGKLHTLMYDVEKKRITFNGHDIVGAEKAKEILRNLKYDNDTIQKVYYIISNHMKLHQRLSKTTIKKLMLKRIGNEYVYNNAFDDLVKLNRYELQASLVDSNIEMEDHKQLLIKIENIKQEIEEELDKRSLIRLVTGHDVIALGIEPGPIISEILQEIEDAQLEGTIKTREEGLKLLGNIIAK